MTAKQLPGDPGGTILIATDGVQFDVGGEWEDLPGWATLYWYLKDDPRGRPDWNRTVGYKAEKFDKISKSD